ncbi:MAG: hypothetical protein QXP25_02985, partial [Thermoplasmatales archaeon]
VRSVSYGQKRVFESAKLFAQTEGIFIAPESAHGLTYAIDEAIRCKQTNESKVIIFNNCGHGLLDLSAYNDYNNGMLQDLEPGDISVPDYLNKI